MHVPNISKESKRDEYIYQVIVSILTPAILSLFEFEMCSLRWALVDWSSTGSQFQQRLIKSFQYWLSPSAFLIAHIPFFWSRLFHFHGDFKVRQCLILVVRLSASNRVAQMSISWTTLMHGLVNVAMDRFWCKRCWHKGKSGTYRW